MKFKKIEKMIGFAMLSLALTILMSSCSKEDGANPRPQIQAMVTDANLKIDALPNMPTTTFNGFCKGCFPVGWSRLYNSVEQDYYAPTGLSTLTNLWGTNAPWITSLPSPGGSGSIVTTSSSFKDGWEHGKVSPVVAQITNLQSGKKYSVTFKISTTRTADSQYSKQAKISVYEPTLSDQAYASQVIDLQGAPAQWITKTITFTSYDSTAIFKFFVTTEPGLIRNYGHIYVAPDAIKQLN